MLQPSHSPRVFRGVHFTLFGFDPLTESKIRFKLVNGGGIDAGKNTGNCTHVIVGNLVYDDPVCVAAREDGKTLVTALWVDHSADIGMPVDVNAVMYKPPKDLNGIPGAKDLFVCLTGYLRQDRDDIMTMVGLMGAHFSKPLVANKVTHLVCYKFEGEKYELAKRMGTIKLVNHCWLEDCLKDWVLLPEDKYNKSGFELETLVEEAKDSEDEAEDPKLELGGRNISKSPPGSKFGTTVTPGLSKTLREEASNPIPDSTGPQVLLNGNIGEDPSTTTRNKNNSDQDADLNTGDLKVHGFQDLGITGDTGSSAQQLNLQDGTLETKKLSYTRSTSTNADGLAHSDEKLGDVSYSRKNQKGFTFSRVSDEYEGGEGNNLETPSTKVEKTCEGIKSACVEGSGKESAVIQEGNGNSLLPQKRTNEASASTKLKSRKITGNAKLSIERTPVKNGKSRLKVPSVVDEPPKSDGFLSVDKYGINNSNTGLIAKSAASASNSVAINKPISGNAESAQCNSAYLNSAQTAVQSLSKSKTGEPDITGFGMAQGDNKAEEQNITTNLDFSSPGKKSKNEGFAGLDDWDLSNEENDKLVRKSPLKKSTTKRTLGSRPRKGVTAKLKSSVCLNKTMPQDEGVSSSTGSKEIAASGVEKRQASLPVLDVNKLREQKGVSGYAEDAGGRTDDIMDDETEAPDDKCESELGMALDEELAHLSKKLDTSTEEKLEAVEPDTKCEEAMPPKNITNETEKQKPPSLLDPTSKLKVKHQAIKRSASKTKKATAAKKIARTVEAVSGEMIPNETRDEGEIKNLPHLEEKLEAAEPDKKCEEAASPKKFTNETEKQNPPSLLDPTSKLKVKHQAIKRPASKTKKATAAKKTAETVEVSGEMIPNETRDQAEIKNLSHLEEKFEAAEPDQTCEEAASPKKFTNETEKQKPPSLLDPTSKLKVKHLAIKRSASKTTKPTAAKKTAETVEVVSGEMIPNETRDEAEMKILKEMPVPSDIKRPASKAKKTTAAKRIAKSEEAVSVEEMIPNETRDEAKIKTLKETSVHSDMSENSNAPRNKPENFVEKENRPNVGEYNSVEQRSVVKRTIKSSVKPTSTSEFNARVKTEAACFILSGHRLQRKEFKQVIKCLKGRVCRDSHQWSYQATHFIAPDPIRRTEKFFAATASGRWILKTDFLTASSQAGKFLPEEPYEWHKNCFTDDGAINMEAPRKWRLLKERTGHGAFYGMRIVVYGNCFVPPLDTLKRAVKAGDGTILATSPPYTRFLDSGVDYAIVSPGLPKEDLWVQEFLKHEIPCVFADYIVGYVCKTGVSLDKYVQYGTHDWADRSFAKLQSKAEEIIEEAIPPEDCNDDDVACQVCGSRERGDVMLICGDESGSVGCGVGTHIDCCNPPLPAVPEEDWFCPECSSAQNSKNLKKKKKRALSSSKTK